MTDAPVVRVSRAFDAAPERVFDAWLDPAMMGRFLFATPTGKMLRVEADSRVGGTFVVVEHRGDHDAEHYGTYVDIDRPRRLVFTFATDREEKPTRVTIDIAPRGQGCELTLTHEMSPEWADFAERTRAGWTMIVDTLATVLDTPLRAEDGATETDRQRAR
jgi:uncharacterized protein YndB with AHSA1/START domain